MIAYDAATQAALADGRLVPRDFLWIRPRNRETGARIEWGLWSGARDITAQVITPAGSLVARDFERSGGLVTISGISKQSGLNVQTPTVVLSGINATAEALVRGYDVRRAPIEVYRGYLDPVNNQLSAPARALFTGFVDTAPIDTPSAGGEGRIVLNCASYLQELTRTNTDRRSDASQRRRSSPDRFFRHVTVVGDWEISWGQKEKKGNGL